MRKKITVLVPKEGVERIISAFNKIEKDAVYTRKDVVIGVPQRRYDHRTMNGRDVKIPKDVITIELVRLEYLVYQPARLTMVAHQNGARSVL